MVELRKRPAPKETATAAPAPKRAASKPRTKAESAKKTEKSVAKAGAVATTAAEGTTKKADDVATAAVSTATTAPTNDSNSSASASTTSLSATSVGQTIDLTSSSGPFTAQISTHDSNTVSLSSLLAKSKRGIVIFTYPKASTPGCTTQACLFRDSYQPLTDAGLGVYGLSADSPKANGTFVTKQRLPYELLCDPEAKVSGAIGMKKPGPAKGTVRGVVVIGKVEGEGSGKGKVEVFFHGKPQTTLDVVLDWIKTQA